MEQPDSFVADAVPPPGEPGLVASVVTPASNGCEAVPPPPAEGVPSDAAPAPYRGGPRTEQGKENSRRNALTHGLTATTLLPEVLDPGRREGYEEAFRDEFAPQTPMETWCVEQMAVHAAALDQFARIEEATLRDGAQKGSLLQALGLDTSGGGGAGATLKDDFLLVSALDQSNLERITRSRRSHERGMEQAYRRLQELQQRRMAPGRSDGETPRLPPPDATCPHAAAEGVADRQREAAAARFPDEASCVAHLADWAKNRPFRCPRCGHDRACSIARRQCLQCARCRRQVSMRNGTLLARSPLPLRTWFLAIGCVLANPGAAMEELAAATGLGRKKTVRQIARRIRDAAEASDASCRLAGLDAVLGPRAAGTPPTPGSEAVGEPATAPATGSIAGPVAAPIAGPDSGPAAGGLTWSDAAPAPREFPVPAGNDGRRDGAGLWQAPPDPCSFQNELRPFGDGSARPGARNS